MAEHDMDSRELRDAYEQELVHRPELLDDNWAYTTEPSDPNADPSRYGPTWTVHLGNCRQLNPNTVLRRIVPTDVVAWRCQNCLNRERLWAPPVRTARIGAIRACPCECNSGGFCGGCGHAGCGRR